ncbi:MAG: lysylphosphatidylglycerol synthase domain-containing protein [Gemmatimonadaceae bacterium]
MSRKSTRIVFAVLGVAAVILAAWSIAGQWRAFRASGEVLHPRWELVAFSCFLVFVAYAILIETWRRTVSAWDNHLPWFAAARIWFISNLGRYLPGKVWQIGAMGVMAQQEGVSAIAATGSAIVINLVNLLAGFGLVAVTGAEFFEQRAFALVLAFALIVALVLAPRILPLLGRVASTLVRRQIDVPRLPDRAIWIAAIGCLAAWLLYGVAFRIFVAGVLGEAPGRTASYVAAFTGSYLLGYIAVFAPGGLGARELSLVTALGRLGLAIGGKAGIIALSSRLWLTVLEVLPGVLLLALEWARGARLSNRSHDTNA